MLGDAIDMLNVSFAAGVRLHWFDLERAGEV
jgi:hypothetical protein